MDNLGSGQSYQNYMNAMNQYMNTAPVSANDIQSALNAKVNNFLPQYQELGQAQAKAYSAPADVMSNLQSMYGSNNGPDMFSRLSSAMNEIGNRMGTAQALGNSIDAQRGRLGDMANSILDTYNQGRQMQGQNAQNLLSLYGTQLGNETQRYSAQLQNAAAMANVALQRQQLANEQAYQQRYLDMLKGGPDTTTTKPPGGPDSNKLTINTTPANIGSAISNVISAPNFMSSVYPGAARFMSFWNPAALALNGIKGLNGGQQPLPSMSQDIRNMGGGGLVDSIKNSWLADPLRRFGDVGNQLFGGNNIFPGYINNNIQ